MGQVAIAIGGFVADGSMGSLMVMFWLNSPGESAKLTVILGGVLMSVVLQCGQ